jgi:hypothetical protein
MVSSPSRRRCSSTWTHERLTMANPLRGEVWLVASPPFGVVR